MSELLARLKASGHAVETVDVGLPGESVMVGLRILTEQDYQDAGFACDALLKAHGTEVSLVTAELVEAEKTTQLLARMVVDPTSKAVLFADALAVRETLSRTQRACITEAYLAHEQRYAPSGRNMPDAEFAELLETVKKTPEMRVLNDLSTSTLKKLLLCLAAQPLD